MPARILIVEDEAITALDLKRELITLGYEVAGIADDFESAVRAARESRPDLVLMDIRLAGEQDGIAAANEIRGNADVPVVFLTAHSDQATLDRALTAAPFGYILKPFQVRELKVCIEVALYKHREELKLLQTASRVEEALEKVRLLTGMLSICAWCKKIRDSSGRWHKLEEYLKSHSEADFTHGICPSCMAEVSKHLRDDRGH